MPTTGQRRIVVKVNAAGLDIPKLATLNAVQRCVVYNALDLDVLRRHEAEEQVRQVIDA